MPTSLTARLQNAWRKVRPAAALGGLSTKRRGDAAEDWALAHLQKQGLRLLTRNYKTPGRGGGEVDLIMQHADTLVFVEVRQRKYAQAGGALASISAVKQRRIVYAAQHYLLRYQTLPPCRFDVVAIDGALDGDLDAVSGRVLNLGGQEKTFEASTTPSPSKTKSATTSAPAAPPALTWVQGAFSLS